MGLQLRTHILNIESEDNVSMNKISNFERHLMGEFLYKGVQKRTMEIAQKIAKNCKFSKIIQHIYKMKMQSREYLQLIEVI